MTIEQIIIASARIAGSLPVLRWAFAGALIAIAVDLSDLWLMGWIRLGGVGNYQAFDKWLDLAYMATFLWVAVRQWDGIHRTVAVALFIYRMIGFTAFELTGNRVLLLAFPNVFEFWFVFAAAQLHWWQQYELTPRRAAAWLTLCIALKLIHEWILHGWRILDNYSATQVVEDLARAIFRIF